MIYTAPSLLIVLFNFIIAILKSLNYDITSEIRRNNTKMFQLFVSREDGVLFQQVFVIYVQLTLFSLRALNSIIFRTADSRLGLI